jgi:transcriptional regulator with XRE-family HTH domain
MTCTAKRRQGNISIVRYKLGLSQQQLADTLGVSRSLIAMFETGKRKLPKAAADIYLDIYKSASAMNPDGGTIIKRGRKPAFQNFSVVTNYDNSTPKTEKEMFLARLELQKTTLCCQLLGLQIKRKTTEERQQQFSNQLICVNAMLDVYRTLFDTLPEGRHRDKCELQAAVLYAQQVKLKQQLKKCSPVALVQMEYQMRILEIRIMMTEKMIAGLETLNYNGTPTEILQYCRALRIAA